MRTPPQAQAQAPRSQRRAPAWWQSVSRSSGDGLPSRLGPEEHVWVGDGRAWLPSLRTRKATDKDRPFAVRPPRAVPAARRWSPSPARDENAAPTADDASAAKKQLLSVLRRRMADGGGAARVGEAALRFRRWVIWNKHTKEQGDAASVRCVEEDGEGAGAVGEEEEGDRAGTESDGFEGRVEERRSGEIGGGMVPQAAGAGSERIEVGCEA